MNHSAHFRGSLAAVAAASLMLGACTYDPYYDYYGGSYHGPAYATSSYTSVFISTGNPRWAYDPYCHAYYDYHRRAYYDPYLHGYYPVGYRPPRLRGVPHPHGWQPGRSQVPAPTQVTNVTINNYQQREASYRRLNHSWAREVRVEPPDSRGRDRGGPSHAAPDRSRDTARGSSQGGNWQRTDDPRRGHDQRSVAGEPRVWIPDQRPATSTDPRQRADRGRASQPPPQAAPRQDPRAQQRQASPQRSQSQPQRQAPQQVRPQPQQQPQRQVPQRPSQPPQVQPPPAPQPQRTTPPRIADQRPQSNVVPAGAVRPSQPSSGNRGGNRGGDQGGARGGDRGGDRSGDQGGARGGERGGNQGSGRGGDRGR